jgi:hypothetical protein
MSTTRVTTAATEIRSNSASVTRRQPLDTTVHGHNLDTKLVPENPGVRKERLLSAIRVEVGATQSDSVDLDNRMASRGLVTGGATTIREPAWAIQRHDPVHVVDFSLSVARRPRVPAV